MVIVEMIMSCCSADIFGKFWSAFYSTDVNSNEISSICMSITSMMNLDLLFPKSEVIVSNG